MYIEYIQLILIITAPVHTCYRKFEKDLYKNVSWYTYVSEQLSFALP